MDIGQGLEKALEVLNLEDAEVGPDPLELSYDHYFYIMLQLKPKDFRPFCGLNRYSRNICADPYFWRKKLEQDFPDYSIYELTYGSINTTDELREFWVSLASAPEFCYGLTMFCRQFENRLLGMGATLWVMIKQTEQNYFQLDSTGRTHLDGLLKYLEDNFSSNIAVSISSIENYPYSEPYETVLVYPIYGVKFRIDSRTGRLCCWILVEKERPYLYNSLRDGNIEIFTPTEENFVDFPMDSIILEIDSPFSLKSVIDEDISYLLQGYETEIELESEDGFIYSYYLD